MKKIVRILSLVMALVLVATCFVGCKKKNKIGNSSTDIEIAYWNAGIGSAWLDAVIKAFEKEHPEYNVAYVANANAGAINSTFEMEGDTVDIYMSLGRYDTKSLEPLDDVLNATVKGESKPIKDKFNASYLELEKYSDGKYYNLTYGGGIVGIVYNKKQFKEAGITQLPRTTNELTAVCDKLYSKKFTPLCHYAASGYWEFLDEVFFAQYDGFDYYLNNFYACTDENGTSPSKELFTKKDGRYEIIKAYEKFITPQYVLQGSNSLDHVVMQTQFLNGMASMMVSGSWLSNEMESIGGIENFEMMRTPVVSAITDKLTTVKTETALRNLITAIDSVSDGEKQLSDYADGENYMVDGKVVSKADWDYVWAARHMLGINYSDSSTFIPKYSTAKEGAKEFLKFLYSDKGIKTYVNTLGITLPIELSEGSIDTSKMNAFEKNQYRLTQEGEYMVTKYIKSRHPIFSYGSADAFASTEYINLFCATNKGDRISAEKAWQKIVDTVNDKYENTWLKNMK